MSHLVEYEPGKIFVGWDEAALAELGYIGVDVPVVKPVFHLFGENSVEIVELTGESRDGIDLARHGDVAYIAVTVIAGTGAKSEDFLVLLIRPFRAAIPVRGSEVYAAGEIGTLHPP